MKLIFLGTSCMVPTKDRNHASIYLETKDQGILFDCGEGTQRQMKQARIKPTKITKIVISHWHGDHVLGLPGLLQTMNASEYTGTLSIYGPKGTKKAYTYMLKAFEFDKVIDINVEEIKEGKIVDEDNFEIFAYELKHRILTFGFKFVEKDRRRINVSLIRKLGIPDGPLLGDLQDNKSITWRNKKISPEEATYVVKGKKIGIIADTLVCDGCNKIAADTDVLVSEAAYMSQHKEKADKYMHLTSSQAASIAATNNVKKLVLTHFSQRYKEIDTLLQEAKDIFPETVAAYDFMKLKI